MTRDLDACAWVGEQVLGPVGRSLETNVRGDGDHLLAIPHVGDRNRALLAAFPAGRREQHGRELWTCHRQSASACLDDDPIYRCDDMLPRARRTNGSDPLAATRGHVASTAGSTSVPSFDLHAVACQRTRPPEHPRLSCDGRHARRRSARSAPRALRQCMPRCRHRRETRQTGPAAPGSSLTGLGLMVPTHACARAEERQARIDHADPPPF